MGGLVFYEIELACSISRGTLTNREQAGVATLVHTEKEYLADTDQVYWFEKRPK